MASNRGRVTRTRVLEMVDNIVHINHNRSLVDRAVLIGRLPFGQGV